ncbi:uncharacterized protein LY79DRAFT_564583 [Colletotrichum navitas]|uniref:Uncharacterized protein n=1 Tax=Colletotrichum navitas TaxID=681940 RepID=A0AAD8PRF3_9PEZI|nr:uncharacterized protein LY79DRAFT_564583 [Colletotrichum navitas]KAK1579333.1 hypothetical protein LY79DRAFT_564583 [Colletotrichum navitas]
MRCELHHPPRCTPPTSTASRCPSPQGPQTTSLLFFRQARASRTFSCSVGPSLWHATRSGLTRGSPSVWEQGAGRFMVADGNQYDEISPRSNPDLLMLGYRRAVLITVGDVTLLHCNGVRTYKHSCGACHLPYQFRIRSILRSMSIVWSLT